MESQSISKKMAKRFPKAGRPKAKIDWDKVKLWLRSQLTGTEIAGKLGIAVDTLYRACERENNVTFAVYSQEFREYGKGDIRLVGYDEAIRNRNIRMLIHLHEWELGQREKRDDGLKEVPQDTLIEKDNENMSLKAQLAKLTEQLLAIQAQIDNQSQARQELPGSDPQV